MLIAKRARELGIDRIVFGSDGNFGDGVTPSKALTDFHALPLTSAEFRTIETNITPYMR